MNEMTKNLQNERVQIYTDIYNNKLPKRIPVELELPHSFLAEYSGIDYKDLQYNYALIGEKAEELCEKLHTDVCPIQSTRMIGHRPPSFYQTLGSQSFLMSNSGFVQHPEVMGMHVDEYDELIEDPYSFLVEKVIPRHYTALSGKGPFEVLNIVEAAKASLTHDSTVSSQVTAALMNKFGYYPGPPAGSSGLTEAPYDFLSDQLRSFSGSSIDIRRKRKQMKEACQVLLPYMFYLGLPSDPDNCGNVYFPLHMPTFLREKDFAEVWLPSFKTILEQYAALGVRSTIFCEGDWTRYLDYLTELPAGTVLQFEYGDPQTIKDKLGKKFIITGLYNSFYARTGTKQQCIDEAKKLLDIMLPGGGYLFSFDKGAIAAGDVNLENYIALADFIHDYAVYENAGESYGMALNSENFVFDESKIGTIKSKYMFDWIEFKKKYPMVPDTAKSNFEKYSLENLKFYLNLLV